MAATIHDVAVKAGVSHTTVSWVIHDDPRISAETKRKVWKAVEELEYHPNYLARGLVSGRSGNVAVVAPSFSTIFELEVMRGIEEELACRSKDHSINQYTTLGSVERKESSLHQILYGKRADAVILFNLRPAPALMRAFNESGLPVVLVEERAEGAWTVKCDNELGAALAVRRLVGSGRRRIGLVNGSGAGEEPGLSPRERLRGFRAALTEARLDPDDAPVALVDDYRFEEGRDALGSLLERRADLDAIFCAAGDVVALGILDEARRRGLSIPGDFALIGFDDVFIASIVTPGLTTLRQPLRLMGSTALSFALEAAQKPGLSPEVRVFVPELVGRETA